MSSALSKDKQEDIVISNNIDSNVFDSTIVINITPPTSNELAHGRVLNRRGRGERGKESRRGGDRSEREREREREREMY